MEIVIISIGVTVVALGITLSGIFTRLDRLRDDTNRDNNELEELRRELTYFKINTCRNIFEVEANLAENVKVIESYMKYKKYESYDMSSFHESFNFYLDDKCIESLSLSEVKNKVEEFKDICCNKKNK